MEDLSEVLVVYLDKQDNAPKSKNSKKSKKEVEKKEIKDSCIAVM